MSRRLRAVALAALLASAAPASGLAQDAARERTGPQAAPPARPSYSKPPAGLPPRTEPDRSDPAIVDTGALTHVRVATGAQHGPAHPPKAWRAPEASAANLRLEHSPGQSLDEAWVGRQLELNGLSGPSASVGRTLALVQLINRAFISAGFVNSGVIVEPSGSPGELAMRVVYGGLAPPAEGRPALSVEWAGGASKGLDAGYVRDRLPSAFRRPLSGIDLERDFRLLAEDPAIRTINADLRPGSRPGEASLALSVYPRDRFDLYVTAANNRSPSVGGERAAAGGSARNLIAAGDLLNAEVGVTRGLEDLAVGYQLPLLSPRTTLSMRASLNDAAVVDGALQALDIVAHDRAYEIGLTRKFMETPLLPDAEPGRWSPARTLSGGVLVTRRTSRTWLLDEPFSFSPGSVDGRSEYTALRLVGDYVVRGVDQVFAVSVTATRGLDGTRSDLPGVPTPKPHFNALLTQVNYARRLSDKGLEIRARVSGQITDSLLYSGERFSAGGDTTVRGYRENLLLADQGVVGSVELGQPLRLSRRQGGGGGFDWGAFAVSGFVDGAALRNHRAPQPGHGIYSVGASLAWTPSEALYAQVTYGQALKAASLGGKKDIQDRGVAFRLTVRPLRLHW